jgi:hypothetical protein
VLSRRQVEILAQLWVPLGALYLIQGRFEVALPECAPVDSAKAPLTNR